MGFKPSSNMIVPAVENSIGSIFILEPNIRVDLIF